MRSPALISICPKTGCHAVLAFLSERYPPLEGRSPTRYSPVCHSTQGRSPFRVRLACIRHAASVDSEPGSNSHVKLVCNDYPFRQPLRTFNTRPGDFTARSRVDWLLRCSETSDIAGWTRSARGLHHELRRPPTADTQTGFLACTFYLVFKEPFTSTPGVGLPADSP